MMAGAVALVGCNGGDSNAGGTAGGTDAGTQAKTTGTAAPSGDKPLVFFGQANSQDPWRQVFDHDIKDAADKHSADFSFEEADATDKPDQQISQIETAMVKKPKVLIVSPVDESVQTAVEKAHDAGTFVILVDRAVKGDKWDCYVGGDNKAIGTKAGEFMGQQMKGKGVILMIRGIASATPTHDRGDGFKDAIKKFPGITIIEGDDCGYNREKAQTFMENFLTSKKHFDAIYAHNDEMAIGAYKAMEQAKAPMVPIVGIDGCQTEVVDMIKSGKLAASFSYPGPGPMAIDIAADFLKGKKPAMKSNLLATEIITKDTADAYVAKHPNLFKK